MTEKESNSVSAVRILRKLQERIIKNFMDILILTELRRGHTMSGPDLIAFINKKFHILISAGTVYSVLYALERKGLTEGTLNGKKRTYKLTDKGEETIDNVLNAKEKIKNFMATFL